jgi:hypothetical protein
MEGNRLPALDESLWLWLVINLRLETERLACEVLMLLVLRSVISNLMLRTRML